MEGEAKALSEVVSGLPNDELLLYLDVILLELERRLLRYARTGPDILQMADEGLVLAARSGARLRQAQSAAAHAAGHLQILGVGDWAPGSTNPGWADDARVDDDPSSGSSGSSGEAP